MKRVFYKRTGGQRVARFLLYWLYIYIMQHQGIFVTWYIFKMCDSLEDFATFAGIDPERLTNALCLEKMPDDTLRGIADALKITVDKLKPFDVRQN